MNREKIKLSSQSSISASRSKANSSIKSKNFPATDIPKKITYFNSFISFLKI